MKLRSALLTLSTFGILASANSIAYAQSETQDPAPAAVTSEMKKEVAPEEAQNERKPPRQATNNVGRQNGTDVICKKSKKKGTRLRAQKICKTRAQWDTERLETMNGLNEIKSQTSVGQVR